MFILILKKTSKTRWLKQWYLNGKRHRKNGPAIEFSTKEKNWCIDGMLHRDHDLPAVIGKKSLMWFNRGMLCRIHSDKPSMISKTYQAWYYMDFLHRDKNKPAVVYKNKNKNEFWELGSRIVYRKIRFKDFTETRKINKSKKKYLISNIDDLPAIEYANGTKEWRFNGNLHRDNDLPAIEYANGDKEWWCLGKRHRNKGPAVIIGNKKYWYKKGQFIKCTF